ncbi:MAG: helix-turn-helix domain-containing protein [Bacteroidaceae bacterium]|nr:helix-turn-helix domain-containing protein [Bacteroidaceae bacterium]
MNIKNVIKRHGWTLERLAAEMKGKDGKKGISQPSVSSIINGNPTIDKLVEIASIIGISVSELVADEDTAVPTAVCPHCGKPISIKIDK